MDTPASVKALIEDNAATAARSSGSATAAPVPSPSPIRRSNDRVQAELRQGQGMSRFGGFVPGLPPLPSWAPGAPATNAAAVTAMP